MLHIVCGDIKDVQIDKDTFIISTPEQNIIDMLHTSENMEILKKAFLNFGWNKLEIKKSLKLASAEENIRVLNSYFNDIVKVK